MAREPKETLNSLLRGEIAATETYQQALAKVGDESGAGDLRRIHAEHREAANTLRKHVREHGLDPDHGSGAWGTFAKAVEGTAKLFGNSAALRALKEGEETGLKDYEEALRKKDLPPDCKSLIESELLPKTREHIPVLDRLIAGMVERVSAAEAKPRVASGEALLVCGYDSAEKFEQYRIEGAMPLDEFKRLEDTIPKNKQIFFYCA